MVRLSYQSSGQSWAIGIEGTEQEITQQYWSFYNHKATNEKKPISMSDTFAYFTTKPEAFFNALKKAELFKILNNREYKGWRAKEVAKERAFARLAQIPAEQFLPENKTAMSPYSVLDFFADNE